MEMLVHLPTGAELQHGVVLDDRVLPAFRIGELHPMALVRLEIEPTEAGEHETVTTSHRLQELLDAGFPLVKRRLFTHPRFEDQRPLIIRHVQERYGVDLSTGL